MPIYSKLVPGSIVLLIGSHQYITTNFNTKYKKTDTKKRSSRTHVLLQLIIKCCFCFKMISFVPFSKLLMLYILRYIHNYNLKRSWGPYILNLTYPTQPTIEQIYNIFPICIGIV